MKKITSHSVALLFTGLTCFSAQAVDYKENGKHHHNVEYVKPGASVSLQHDYDGKTQRGDLEFFTITLQHLYTDGFISARLLNTPGLDIHSNTNVSQIRAKAEQSLIIPVQISATQMGEYYLGVEVLYEGMSGDQSVRVLSVPILVGIQPRTKGESAPLKKSRTIKKTGIISLPAQEDIQ